MSIQDKISANTYEWKQKIFDTHIEYLGNEVKALNFDITEINHYGDTELTISTDNQITAIIDFPNNEVPITFDTGNQSEEHFHLYDVLPIEGYFKFEDNIKVKDIIVLKIQISPSNTQLVSLQVLEPIVRAMKYVTWQKFRLAPYTFNIDKYPEIQTIFDNYLSI